MAHKVRISEQLEESAAAGSILVTDGSNKPMYLAPGSDGQVLQVASGVPSYGAATDSLQISYDGGDTIDIGASGPVQINSNGNRNAIRVDSDATTARGLGLFSSAIYTGTALNAFDTSRINNAAASGTLKYMQHQGTGTALDIAHLGTDGRAISATSTNDLKPTVEYIKNANSANDVFAEKVVATNAGAGDAIGSDYKGLLSSGKIFEFVNVFEIPIKLDGIDHRIPVTERNTELYGADQTLVNGTDDVVFADALADMTITLPTPTPGQRNCYTVVRVDNTTNVVSIAGAGGETINGNATVTISNPTLGAPDFESITVIWKNDTTEWRII